MFTMSLVFHQVQEFIAKPLSAHLVLFTTFLNNLDFVWMVTQILVENSANATFI